MEQLSDEVLIERAVNGDAAAFRLLLNRHYATIYKIAYKWCGHKQDAEDVAQDVCMKLADALPGFKGQSAFTSWLYRMTLNAARDLFRQRTAARGREAAYANDVALHPEPCVPQEEEMTRKEALLRFSTLPEELKEAVLLVAGEGMSHREAAKLLGCAESTVSWRLMKAKQRLAEGEMGHG